MSLVVPTTRQLSETIIAQIEASLGQSIPLLPKSFSRVLAKALAGSQVLLYKYAGFILLQLFVEHATMQEVTVNGRAFRPLVEWGRLIGEGDPEPATRAELVVSVTVLDQSGSLPSTAQLVRAETGVIYRVVSAVELDAPTLQVAIRPVSDQQGGDGSGAIGNLEAGDVVSFANPLPGVARNATVVYASITGADAEDPEVYRARVIRRFKARRQGGAYADYQAWAEGVPGIFRAYPYTGAPGEVDVYVEATAQSSGSDDGIPTDAQRQAVADAIELSTDGLASRRPANAAVNVLPIGRTAFDVEVNALGAEDVVSAKSAIEAALDEFFRSREPFIVGVSVLPRFDRITRAAVSGVVDDILSASGDTAASVALKENGSDIAARTLGQGEKAKLGSVTYV